ncbi:MAG: dihydrofolate reductase [Bacteriovorax sp.]|nr:dihydrofolate reductase [Bacteriovorax sp.]
MIVSLIVAVGPKGEIGNENKLLWHISEDLKNFKKITNGKAIVMGRKTFESIGKALPNRKNIVLSRDPQLSAPGIEVISDPLMAFDIALDYEDGEESEMVIIGGEEIFKIYLPYVQKIYLSEVQYEGPADAFFPTLNESEWQQVEEQKFDQFNFRVLIRNQA